MKENLWKHYYFYEIWGLKHLFKGQLEIVLMIESCWVADRMWNWASRVELHPCVGTKRCQSKQTAVSNQTHMTIICRWHGWQRVVLGWFNVFGKNQHFSIRVLQGNDPFGALTETMWNIVLSLSNSLMKETKKTASAEWDFWIVTAS